MKILFIIDPLPGLRAYKDTSVAMMRSLQARGAQLHVTLQSEIFATGPDILALHQSIEIADDADLYSSSWWTYSSDKFESRLSDFDAVIMRKDPPFDIEYLYATHLLEKAEKQGARVFNSGRALRDHPEKLSITEYSQYTSPTLVSSQNQVLRRFYDEHQDVILKPLDGMGGAGIFRLKPGDANFNSVVEMLTDQGQRHIMIQKFLPDIKAGDKRILIINGEPIPYVLARIPSQGENRGNIAAGGSGVAQPITDSDREMARKVGAELAPKGLFLIGLDVIGSNITEINVTSPTCFVEITHQTDFNVADHFADQLLKVL